ncbi:hypothetical protein G7Z17_g10261 [Cylindrodendrum hubeiense]|uniref:Major facilitator superfamily (MFS) profile domain-containing protein n=1 Tax=Cylindrodendrum hubeiense TaxID=595255 RepID=A0A9P5LCH5_9HYPO|nr:hypothetical protein G7Z17_g10261 [Cylindrodendrum hubeiense]
MSGPKHNRESSNGHHQHMSVSAQVNNRRANDQAIIENPLAHLTDDELKADVQHFHETYLRSVDYEEILRGARVAKDIRTYDQVARDDNPNARLDLPVQLTPDEKRAIRRERDVPFSEKGMRIVILTVSLAAFLQGFVQSSFNGASLFKDEWGLNGDVEENNPTGTRHSISGDDWRLGAANGSPWFFAALVGCPLSLPINYWFGRRGGMAFAAVLIFSSSLGAVFARNWLQLFCVRIVNGIGMGVKAVSTPILASETAIGFWRGSAILAWQLWVAFGIMMGFAFNLIFTTANSDRLTLGLIQGAPMVPALALFIAAIFFCPESPRYHLLKGPNYSPEMAYQMLRRVRNTELQALRDIYVVHKSIEQETLGGVEEELAAMLSPGFWWTLRDFFRQFRQLFQQRRLCNAVISSSVVNLAQQLCGINVIAFYSGTLFNRAGADKIIAMGYSLGLVMAVLMAGGALSFLISSEDAKIGVLAFFLFVFAAAYSPGMGPIPFTIASESFPLSHREAVNLGDAGSLGLFSGLNVLAFILVFLLVEETKRRNLEDLDLIFAVSKRRFMSFQVMTYLPWVFRRYVLRKMELEPQFYHDLIWDPASLGDNRPRVGGEAVGSLEDLPGVEAAGSERALRTDFEGRARPDSQTEAVEKTKPAELDSTNLVELDTAVSKHQ